MNYLALLRGINVSGKKLIKMDALRTAISELSFKDVSTYIQSGNILFDCDLTARNDIERLISSKILSDFGHEVTVMVLTKDEVRQTISQNPFSETTIKEATQPYVCFLSEEPLPDRIEALARVDFGEDGFAVIGNRLYIRYAQSAGTSKLNNAMIERKLGVWATARNWKTMNKLMELMSH